MEDHTELHKKDQQSWDKRWETNTTPFDKGQPHAAFLDALERSRSGSPQGPAGADADGEGGGRGDEDEDVNGVESLGLPRTGRALVPGCGRGYDVHALSLFGLDSTGLEVSPKAVKEANSWIDAQGVKQKGGVVKDEEGVVVDTAGEGGKEAKVVLGDFFKWEFEGGEGGYDLFYDYTFLCALPPTLRKPWAETYTRLSHPGSFLITLQFPLNDDRTDGPPYALTRELYTELLGNEWEEVWGRDVREDESRGAGEKLGAAPPEPFRKGRERVVVWKRRG